MARGRPKLTERDKLVRKVTRLQKEIETINQTLNQVTGVDATIVESNR